MLSIQCPVDVKYKGTKIKAYTPFTCDSSDFQKLYQPLGAWAFVEKKKNLSQEKEAPKKTNKESK